MPTDVTRATLAVPLVDRDAENTGLGITVLASVIHNHSLPDLLIFKNQSGMVNQVEKLYEYTSTGESYYGNPKVVAHHSVLRNEAQVELYIGGAGGLAEGVIEFNNEEFYAKPNSLFFAESEMYDDAGFTYDRDTGIASAHPFVITTGDILTLYDTKFVGTDVVVRFSAAHLLGGTTLHTFTFLITNLEVDNYYYQVMYSLAASPTVVKYWIYDPLTLDILAFNGIHYPGTDAFTYLPTLPVRVNKVSLVNGVAGYDSAKFALDLIGINIDDMVAEVNANPDIDDIEDVSVRFAVDVETQDDADADYIWQMMKEVDEYGKTRFFPIGGEGISNYYTSLDSVNSYMTFDMSWVDEKIITGTMPANRIQIFTETDAYTYTFADPGRLSTQDPQVNSGAIDDGGSLLVVRKYIDATTYSEFTAGGLGNLYFAGSNRDFMDDRNKYISADVRHIGQTGYNKVYIPVNLDTVKNAFSSSFDAGHFLSRSMIMEINVRAITDYAWYETAVFFNLIEAAAIAIAVVTGTPGIETAIIDAASYYLATLAVAEVVFTYYLTGVAIDYALDFLIQEFGLENTFIAIAVVAVVAITTQTGNVTGLADIPFAADFLAYTTMTLGQFTSFINDSFEDLIEESEEFVKASEEKQAEIDEANELLGDSSIDILNIVLTEDLLSFEETPDQFFNRTSHTGNPGVLALEVIPNYVESALELPTLGQLSNLPT